MTQMHPETSWVPYGPPALEELRRAVSALKGGDLLKAVTVIVPNNLAGVVARRHLARGLSADGPTGVAGLMILTVDRLAEQVAAPLLAVQGKAPLTSAILAAAWRRALADDPDVFEEVAEHPATVAALVRAHRELRELAPEQLDAVGAGGRLPQALVGMHRRVVEATQDRWYDVVTLRTTAAKAMPDPGPTVVYCFQELERSQLQVLRAVTHARFIGALTGTRRADRGVIETAIHLELEEPEELDTKRTADQVHHASDSDDEVRTVVRRIVASLQDRPGHRIAVLHGARVPYARLLHEQLAQAGITFNGPGVRTTAERQIPRAVLQLLELAERDVDRVGLFRLLSGTRVRDGKDTTPTANWERLSRNAGIVGPDDWAPNLSAYIRSEQGAIEAQQRSDDPSEGIIARSERNRDAADRLLRFVTDLRAVLAKGREASTWNALSGWATDLITTYVGDEESFSKMSPEEQRAATRVRQALTGLNALSSISTEADLRTVHDVLELELEDDLPRVGTFGTGVFVGPLSNAVGLEVDELYLVGLAEGLSPARVRNDALLPDSAREAGGLPPLRARLDREQRHVQAAMAAAPTVVASFPRGDLRRGGERLPSRWLMPTLEAMAEDPSLQATEWRKVGLDGSPSFAASLMLTDQPAHEQEWRVRALISNAPTPEDAVLDASRTLLHARHSNTFTRFDGNLGSVTGLPDPADGERVSSPTALESWVTCPHAFFLRKVLYIEAVEQPEELISIGPADRGTLMHDALDAFFRAGHLPDVQGLWDISQREALRDLALERAKELEESGRTGHPTMWERERALVLDDLDRLLTQDEKVRSTHQREQVSSELAFGRKSQPAVEVPLPDGRTVRMVGSADRVDKRADGSLVVTDYKSGKADAFKGLSEDDPDKNGSKLQLPAYALAARAAHGDKPVHAEYWFIGAKDRGKLVGYDVTAPVLDRYGEVLTTITDGIRQGVFPANAPEDRPWSPFVACVYCDPDGLGAKERRVQWEAKKHAPEIAGYLALTEPDGDTQ
jgi:RecB family exonuclease